MAHFLCHLGCSHFGALLLDFHFTENKAMVDNSLNDILAAATGSTFPNVGKELLNGFHVIIPDEITLQKYGPQGSAIFRMITDNAKEIDSLYALKKTLLFKLTT